MKFNRNIQQQTSSQLYLLAAANITTVSYINIITDVLVFSPSLLDLYILPGTRRCNTQLQIQLLT